LNNIFKELLADVNIIKPHGSLESWASQGVLLLNSILTVEEGKPESHKGIGWEKFTDEVLNQINTKLDPVVFLLWGKKAIEKKKYIDSKRHLVLESVHPSPLSAYRGFFGCRHFSKTNAFLESHGLKAIRW
jgi:uracil-DNA glycosylase